MAAPLRRVFSKRINWVASIFHDHTTMTSTMSFCIRCSKPLHISETINMCRAQFICSFQGLSSLQYRTLPKCCVCKPRCGTSHVSLSQVTNCKLNYMNKCNHQHLFRNKNFISGDEQAHSHRNISTYCSYRKRKMLNSVNISVTKLAYSSEDLPTTQSRSLRSGVLCKNASNKNEKEESKQTTVLPAKENIYTIPNLLTFGRMLSAPFLGYMVMNESFVWALGLFAFAGVSDLLDGFIARNFKNQNSILGSALDPMADKILISVLTLTLTAVNLIPVPLTALIVGRDAALMAAAFYLRYVSLPPPKTVSRYFDVTLISAKLEPFTVSKWNTAFQLSLVALTLAAPVFNYVDHPFLHGLWYLTGATTFISGVQYVLFWKDSVKILKPQQKK